MNRIEQLSRGETMKVQQRPAVEMARCSQADGPARHTFFSPMHYEKGYAYPLIVWLHGSGGHERQVVRVMPLVSMRNYVAVAPQGTLALRAERSLPAFTWQQSEEHIGQAEQRVFAAIAASQEKFHIAPHRIFIAGFGAGGTMALRIALRCPEQFAGAISIGGAFPEGHSPLRRLKEVRPLPLFLAVGNSSTVYPASAVCRDLRLFHAAGLSVSLRQYPCGDELTTLMLADTDRWIMERVCPSSAPCAADSTD